MKYKILYLSFFTFYICNVSAQNLDWAKSFGDNDEDIGLSITADVDGNVYTIGKFKGTIDFDPGNSTFNLTSNGSADIFIQKLNNNGNFLWAKSFGSNGYDSGNSITTDVNGDVYLTGYFEGTVDFDPSNSTFNLSSNGDSDIFIQKLDANGNFLWAKSSGSDGRDIGTSITTDAYGNVYTTGFFYETVDFDPSNSTFNLSSNGDSDIFIQKLDANGNFLWAKSFGSNKLDSGNSITTDVDGNVYTTGVFYETVDFDPSNSTFSLASNGSTDIFIQKLDANGNFLWAKSFGSNRASYGYSITTDADGNVYTTGFFYETVDFDPSPSDTFNLTSNGFDDIFIQKLDANGNFLWAKSFGSNKLDHGYSITTDADGNVYTTGFFYETIDFDPSNSTFNLASNGSADIFIQKLDANGNFLWAKSFGGYYWDFGHSITTDIDGNVYTTGGFTGVIDFDPSNSTFNLASNGDSDIFIQKLNPIISSVTIPSNTSIIRAYPNPSRDRIKIDLEKHYKNITIKAHNTIGQLINTYHYKNTKSIHLDLNEEQGLYFLELSADDKHLGTVKVMKE